MINKTQYQALAIGQVASSKYNGLSFYYGNITAKSASHDRDIFTLASLSYSIKSNLKLWLFCGNQRGNLFNGNQIKRMVRSEVRTKHNLFKRELDNLNYDTITKTIKAFENFPDVRKKDFELAKVTKTVTKLLKTEQANLYQNSITFTKAIKVFEYFSDIRKKDFELDKSDNYLLSFFANFSRQALITQAEKLLLSFLTLSSICSISSWGKRIPLVSELLFLYPVAIIRNLFQVLVFRHYTTNNKDKKVLTCLCTLHYSVCAPSNYLGVKITIPRSATTLSRDLTKLLSEVIIMANRYDSAHLRVKQSQDPNSKKHLPIVNHSGYINTTLAKSKVRISTLHILLVTHDAPSVFFCVNACAYLSKIFTSMVALVGRLKGRLVSSSASSANPVNVTAKEFSTSRGDYINHLLEAVTMTTIPNTLTPKKFKFYNPVTSNIISVIATNEAQARDEISPCCVFIFRQPLAMGVCHE